MPTTTMPHPHPTQQQQLSAACSTPALAADDAAAPLSEASTRWHPRGLAPAQMEEGLLAGGKNRWSPEASSSSPTSTSAVTPSCDGGAAHTPSRFPTTDSSNSASSTNTSLPGFNEEPLELTVLAAATTPDRGARAGPTTTTTTTGIIPESEDSCGAGEVNNAGRRPAMYGTIQIYAPAATPSDGPKPQQVCMGATAAAAPLYDTGRLLHGLMRSWCTAQEESKARYQEGGYLAVTPGKPLRSRYVMMHKLGWGEFSTVWLAYDTKHATLGRGPAQAFVAVKVAKCHPGVHESTRYEIGLLSFMKERFAGADAAAAPLTNLIDSFEVDGAYGRHLCMVMPVHGSNLLALIDQFKTPRGATAPRARSGEEQQLVRECLASTLTGLQHLHRANIIHTDIKPENVLCAAPDPKVLAKMETFCQRNAHRSAVISTATLHEHVLGEHQPQKPTSIAPQHLFCIADFGLSAVLEPAPLHGGQTSRGTAAFLHARPDLQPLLNRLVTSKAELPVRTAGTIRNRNGVLLQTREYRAPEVLLGLDITPTADVWSVGCMAFELITGEFLLDPKRRFAGQPRSSRLERQIDIEHMAMIAQLIGPMPPAITSLRTRHNTGYYAERARLHGSTTSMMNNSSSSSSGGSAGASRPPMYIHRYVDEAGDFMYAQYYRDKGFRPRDLAAELRPFLGGDAAEARLAASFILSCLSSYDPRERPTAEAMLRHPWLQPRTSKPL